MRHPRPLRCPACGELPEACLGCGRAFVDRDGRKVSPPPVRRWWWSVGWPGYAISGLVLVWFFVPGLSQLAAREWVYLVPVALLAAVLLGNAHGPLIWVWRRLRCRFRLERDRRHAGEARDIAQWKDGLCRIRGRVYVLRSASWSADDVGAYCLRLRTNSHLSEHQRCGRFAVVDASGIAIVDDDRCEVVPLDGRIHTQEELAAREGDVVEVIGPARRAPAPDVHELVQGTSYRDGTPVALVFDGQPRRPVTVAVSRYVG